MALVKVKDQLAFRSQVHKEAVAYYSQLGVEINSAGDEKSHN